MSVGISILMGALAVYVREGREFLVTQVNPFNPLLRQLDPDRFDPTHPAGLEMINNLVQREALMLGYVNDFRLMTVITLCAMPLVFALRPPPAHRAAR
jgi:DHA2 family multidrug resistance protein